MKTASYKNNYILIFLIVVLLLFSKNSIAQEIPPDSLLQKSYTALKANFDKNYIDTIPDLAYAKAYLYKAKKNKDTIHMANAYIYISRTQKKEISLKYTDSIITITKNSIHKNYPSIAYIEKGNILFENTGNTKEALNLYLLAVKDAEKKQNIIYALTAKLNIGIIKNHLEEYEEALPVFKEYITYLDNTNIKFKEFYYIKGLHSLANAYIFNKKYDSASVIIDKGIKLVLKERDTFMYSNYVLTSGINFYHLKKYNNAIDSLNKAYKLLSDQQTYTIANIFLGKVYEEMKSEENAIKHYEKVDSIIKVTKVFIPHLIKTNKSLINYYKKNGNIQKQLYYVNRLIYYDSILKSDNRYLQKKIHNDYEIPELLKTKEVLIKELENKQNTSKTTNIILYIISTLLLLIAGYFVQRNLSYKKRFTSLMKDNETTPEIPVQSKNTINLPEAIITEILEKLADFEQSEKVIKKGYTLQSLAKELKTNSKYLSKVINVSKEMNFTNYINTLKVDVAIKKLKEEKRFRVYTMKAIAEEVGFSSADRFSKAFRKRTGLYPSYFIKQLEKNF